MQLNKRVSITGLVIAYILYRESLQPVLLPLNLNSQLIFSGITVALGYDIGLLLEWFYKKLKFKKITLDENLVKLSPLLFVVLLFLISKISLDFQQEFRLLLNIENPTPSWFLVPIGSLTIAWLLLEVGHKIRNFAKAIARIFKEPFPIVYTVTCILIALVGYLILVASFFFLQTSLDVTARPDISNLNPPTSPLFSGSKESQIPWVGLGQKGQEFTSIRSDFPEKIKDPIRIYAGVENEADLDKRVELIMKDFERTKAFERSTVVLFTPSGSGWVNPKAVEMVEKLTRGDSTSISLQYSNKQAVIQYIMDPQAAGRSSSLLFSKLRERLDKIELSERPKFYVYGESLGSLGSQEIFKNTTVEEISQKVDGVIWVGSPSSSPLWKRLSPYGSNSTVQITNKVRDLEVQNIENPKKILFLYNTTDPVVWSNSKIIYRQPDWLKSPLSTEINKDSRWLPALTFGHLYFELYSATKYPSGIGHNYEEEIPCAIAYVLQHEAKDVCSGN